MALGLHPCIALPSKRRREDTTLVRNQSPEQCWYVTNPPYLHVPRSPSLPYTTHGLAMVIAVFNNKGGVGKTACAVNLATALSRHGTGKRVLLVDLDPQASATLSLSLDIAPGTPSLADVLLSGVAASDAIRTTTNGPDVLPASMALAGADLALMAARTHGRESALRDALNTVRDRYTYTIIDCPPAFSLLTLNGIIASHAAIIPTPADFLAVQGLVHAANGLQEIAGQFGVAVPLLGILLTFMDHRPASSRDIATRLRQTYGRVMFRTEIPRTVRLAEAPLHGTSVLDYAPRSAAAIAYTDLAAEVATRSKKIQAPNPK